MVPELHLVNYEGCSNQNRCLHHRLAMCPQWTAGKCFVLPNLIEKKLHLKRWLEMISMEKVAKTRDILKLQNLCLTIAAAASKSLQSCPTLCDPIDGSSPGSPSLGFSRQEHWSGLPFPFSNAWQWKVKVKLLSRVRLLETPWTAAHQVPPSMGFSRPKYWSGLPLLSPLTIAQVVFME